MLDDSRARAQERNTARDWSDRRVFESLNKISSVPSGYVRRTGAEA